MRRVLITGVVFLYFIPVLNSWGFYGHQHINQYAVFLLPPEMMVLFKPHLDHITEHAVDPDKRRYAIKEEAPRHYIDMDHYGTFPFDSLPRKWKEAIDRFSEDSLNAHGIVPWWIQVMLGRLTNAFRDKNVSHILQYAAELGHYLADAHVPLHTSSNHNGQFTDQKGIHGFWESRIPELLAEKKWDLVTGKAQYISDPLQFTWKLILESAKAVDSVLRFEKELSFSFPADQRYSYESRKGIILKQYSSAYAMAYNEKLNGMVERRMRASIHAVASFWYTAWINAGQPDLSSLKHKNITKEEENEMNELNRSWKANGAIKDH